MNASDFEEDLRVEHRNENAVGHAKKYGDNLDRNEAESASKNERPPTEEEKETSGRGNGGGGYQSTTDFETILRQFRRYESGSEAPLEAASPLEQDRITEDNSVPTNGDAAGEENSDEIDVSRGRNGEKKSEPGDLLQSPECATSGAEPREENLARKRRLFEQRENVNPFVVTLRSHPGEVEIHSEDAMYSIQAWRALRAELHDLSPRSGNRRRSTEYIGCRERILSLEIYLIEEHGLTISSGADSGRRAAWDELQRNEQAVVRRAERAGLKDEYERAREEELRDASIRMLKGLLRSPVRLLRRLRRSAR